MLKEITFSMRPLAEHVCEWYARQYPQYTFRPFKGPGQRRWRIATSCKATGAFLQFQKD